jgi:hypothetical protein
MQEKQNNSRNLLSFAIRTRIIQVLVALAALSVVAAWIFLNRTSEGKLNIDFWLWMEPLTGLTTLAVAGLVWFGELKQDWYNSLPKRLTVQFVYKFSDGYRMVLQCTEAYLTGEDDIRAWGQQVGQQMADRELLMFQPYIYEAEEPLRDNIRLYTVTFVLDKLPEKHGPGKALLSDGSLCDLNENCLCMAYNSATESVEKKTIAQKPWSRPKSQ